MTNYHYPRPCVYNRQQRKQIHARLHRSYSWSPKSYLVSSKSLNQQHFLYSNRKQKKQTFQEEYIKLNKKWSNNPLISKLNQRKQHIYI